MALCPKDWKPCCDDLCYGAGCLRTGQPMYERCSGCGNYVAIDWSDDDDCTCDYDDDYYSGRDDPFADNPPNK